MELLAGIPRIFEEEEKRGSQVGLYCYLQPGVKCWFRGTASAATAPPVPQRSPVTFHDCWHQATGKHSHLTALNKGHLASSLLHPQCWQLSPERSPGLCSLHSSEPTATAQPGLSDPPTPFCLFSWLQFSPPSRVPLLLSVTYLGTPYPRQQFRITLFFLFKSCHTCTPLPRSPTSCSCQLHPWEAWGTELGKLLWW